jgi:hypothetical protein
MHDIDISDDYIDNNFKFKIDDALVSQDGCNRIFSYANKILRDPQNQSGLDSWSIVSKSHSYMVELCLKNDYENFSSLMMQIAKTPLVYGFMNYSPYSELIHNSNLRSIEAKQFIDKLISLSEYKGIISVLNPEQGPWKLTNPDFAPLLSNCFYSNNEIIPPPAAAGGAYGVATNLGLYCLKDLKSLYTAERLKKISTSENISNINEVGAGLGFTSYYASKIFRSNYKIYDLPTVSIMQAYFLMRSLGESAVCLEGETSTNLTKVSLFPFWSIYSNSDEKSIWVNHDSLPEIDIEIAKKYIDKFASTKTGYFLSINQEAQAPDSVGGHQHRVPDTTKNDPRLVLMYRCRDFLRLGYIEELYKINNPH